MSDYATEALQKWPFITEVNFDLFPDFVLFNVWDKVSENLNDLLTETDEVENNTLTLPNYYFARLTKKTVKRARKYCNLWFPNQPLVSSMQHEKNNHLGTYSITSGHLYFSYNQLPAYIFHDLPKTNENKSSISTIKFPFSPPSKDKTKQSYTSIIDKLNLPVIELPKHLDISKKPIPENKTLCSPIKTKLPHDSHETDFHKMPSKPAIIPQPTTQQIREKLRYPDYTLFILEQNNHPITVSMPEQTKTIHYPDYTNYVLQKFTQRNFSFGQEKNTTEREWCYPDYTKYFIWQHFHFTKNNPLDKNANALKLSELNYPDFSLFCVH